MIQVFSGSLARISLKESEAAAGASQRRRGRTIANLHVMLASNHINFRNVIHVSLRC